MISTYFLHWCWLIISEVPWHLLQGNSTWINTSRPRRSGWIFAWRQFQVHFLEWAFKFWLGFHWSLLPCVQGSNWQYSGIGSDNGLAPARWRAIIWTNDDLLYWRIYTRHSASVGLSKYHSVRCFSKSYKKTKTLQPHLPGPMREKKKKRDVVGVLPVGAAPTTSSFST